MALVAVPWLRRGVRSPRSGVASSRERVRIVSLYERGGQEAPLRSIAAMIEVVSEEPLRLMPITMIWERARWRPSGPRHRSVDAITRAPSTARNWSECDARKLGWLLHSHLVRCLMGFQYRTFKTCAFGRWPPRTWYLR